MILYDISVTTQNPLNLSLRKEEIVYMIGNNERTQECVNILGTSETVRMKVHL